MYNLMIIMQQDTNREDCNNSGLNINPQLAFVYKLKCLCYKVQIRGVLKI